MFVRATLMLGCLLLAGCPRGDRAQCEKACRNYATLSFPEEIARGEYPDLAQQPGETQEALALRRQAALTLKLEDGIHMCVSQCVAAGNDDQIKCMGEATTVTAARSCADEWDPKYKRKVQPATAPEPAPEPAPATEPAQTPATTPK